MLRLFRCMFCLAVLAPALPAQGNADDQINELRREMAERERQIGELLKRIENLENRPTDHDDEVRAKIGIDGTAETEFDLLQSKSTALGVVAARLQSLELSFRGC